MKFFDRDISWLSFNKRVLMEAANSNVPLYERVKFLAIYSSNLDEFFRVRVAGLRSIAEIDKKKINKKFDKPPKEILEGLISEVHNQQEEFGKIKRNLIIPQLKKEGIYLYRNEPLRKEHKAPAEQYFKEHILATLDPTNLTEYGSEVPHLENKSLYLVLEMQNQNKAQIGLVKIPAELPRFFELPKIENMHYYVTIDDIIRENVGLVFSGIGMNQAYSIKLNRDADLQIEDEYSGNLVAKIEKQIKKRDMGAPARFLYDASMPKALLEFLMKRFDIGEKDLVEGGRYHNMNDLFQLPNPVSPLLENAPLPALHVHELDEAMALFNVIDSKDILLHFPYQSYDYVLRFFEESSEDESVTDIKATFYRIAADSAICKSLIKAAENGKSVTVFVEVKARFDEANNLQWAERMENAGVKIIYSIPGLKVHAKVALITRKSDNNRVKKYAYFGTGNFNEKTAKIYADEALLTCQDYLTDELDSLFSYLNDQNLSIEFKELLVAQFNIRKQFRALVDREIEHAKKGHKGHIIIKLNNLEDEKMINKLYEASEAGVKVELIVRAICRLRPGVEGMSENITVHRIVDRYLEHSRVFYFYNNGAEDLYLGSADWMKRNLYHRIEVVFPLYDPALKGEVFKLLEIQLSDNVKGCLLDEHLQNQPLESSLTPVQAQLDFYEWLKDK
ncbi:MAG: polyphosphate kinase 1 [Bacteroidota bacterium]